jgi:hypothetical protein
MNAQSAKLRIRYLWNGVSFEELVFGVCAVSSISTPGMFSSEQMIFWSLDYMYSIRAKAGELDQYIDLSQTIAHSLRVNPQWYMGIMQVSQYMIQNQIQNIRQIGQISRIISQTSNQISDMMMESYYERQRTMD